LDLVSIATRQELPKIARAYTLWHPIGELREPEARCRVCRYYALFLQPVEKAFEGPYAAMDGSDAQSTFDRRVGGMTYITPRPIPEMGDEIPDVVSGYGCHVLIQVRDEALEMRTMPFHSPRAEPIGTA